MVKLNNNSYTREDEIYVHKYAARSCESKKRVKSISCDDDNIRTEFQRDCHRIYYSQPFRRLRHKTQVFYLPINDHICTRLEHAIYVASAARTVARALKLNEDLTEAIGLGHDLGHAPFGHCGENILRIICICNNIRPTFDHEVNSLRVVDKLAQFDREDEPGLNLTYGVRDGIVSHCGEDFKQHKIIPCNDDKDLEKIVYKEDAKNPTTLEGCIVRLIDKVAYAGRDLEDGIQANLIGEDKIPKDIVEALGKNNGEIVGTLISDIIENSPIDENYISMSKEKFDSMNELIGFNYKNIYGSEKVKKYEDQVETSLKLLYENFVEVLNKTGRFTNETEVNKIKLSKGSVFFYLKKFISDLKYTENDDNKQIVIDFISGCTDNYILKALEEVFVPKPIV